MPTAVGCCKEELWGKGLVQMLLRIPWSSVSDFAERTWMVKWNFVIDQMWENPTNCGSIFLGGWWERSALWVVGVFPAAGWGSCAVNLGQAVTVGFSQCIQTSLSLGRLEWFISHLCARISCEHFPSTPSDCGLGFVVFFFYFLCRGKFPIGYRGCETVVGWEFLALGPGFASSSPCWAGKGSCVPPHQFTRWADWGSWDRGMVWSQTLCWGSSWISWEMDRCVSSAGTVPVHQAPADSSSPCFPLGVPSRDTNCPALLILNTRRCKSHLTFSFRNCDLFSELLTSIRDRNTLPSSALFQITACGKDWGALLCFCWGVKRRNSLHVIVKLKVQKFCFFWFLTLS